MFFPYAHRPLVFVPAGWKELSRVLKTVKGSLSIAPRIDSE